MQIFSAKTSKTLGQFRKKQYLCTRMTKSRDIGLRKLVLLGLWIVLWLSTPVASYGRTHYSSRGSLVWTRHTDHYGRYTGRYLYVAKGFNVSLGANYYYGDIDYSGRAFKEGFQPKNLLGGLTLTYQHPIGPYFNLRSSVGVGALRGAADSIHKGQPMSFKSIYLEPSVCVDYYPFAQFLEYWLGLYVFVGFGANVSVINYDFGNPPGPHVTGNVVRCLPVVPFGLGWAFPLGRASGLMLHVEASMHQGVMDTPVMNLDAYPQTKSQNGVRDYGLSRHADTGKKTNEWYDGYFQVGLTLSYRWM